MILQRSLLMPLLLVIAAAAGTQTATTRAKRPVTVLLSNGQSVSGSLAQISAEEVQVDTGDAYKTIKLDDVQKIEFGSSPNHTAPPAQPTVERYQLAAADAAQALRRLTSGTQVGLSLLQYNQMVVEVYEAVSLDLTAIPDGDLHDELAAAMEDYVFARNFWQASVNYPEGVVPTKSDIARQFNARYNIGLKPKMRQTLKQDVVLQIIWESAAKHMVAALKLLQ
ncbi:MAG: hypothetical protein QOE46_320 [Acidobacteriota bacterium]|nr:hypothetical protein [Acidobacteriota bacterium]